MFGVTTRGQRQQALDQRRARLLVEQHRAALGDHHRVDHHRRLADEAQRLDHRVDGLRRAEHADLDRVDADVLGDRRDLGDDRSRGETDSTASTPTVFCAVIAVIAVIPCTPQRAKAFRSAWMPAPPPESEPAIERTAGTRPSVRFAVAFGPALKRLRGRPCADGAGCRLEAGSAESRTVR